MLDKIEKQFVIVRQQMKNLWTDFDSEWMNMELQLQVNNLLTFISLALTAFQSKQKRFFEALSLGSHGNSHTPIFLPPQLFLTELDTIQHEIR